MYVAAQTTKYAFKHGTIFPASVKGKWSAKNFNGSNPSIGYF